MYEAALSHLYAGHMTSAEELFTLSIEYAARGLLRLRPLQEWAALYLDYIRYVYSGSTLRDDFTGA